MTNSRWAELARNFTLVFPLFIKKINLIYANGLSWYGLFLVATNCIMDGDVS